MVTSTFSDNWKSLDNACRSRKLLLNLREYSLGTPALVVTDQELFGLI
ncbi:17158_t:CDS:2 [Rhizophagus irregularis]|nr:17158_t:CDS:2 [Rhizophagus irregularis]